jgi:DNA-binding response OmpR family regulator
MKKGEYMEKILIVEDNESIRRLLELELTHARYEIEAVGTGEEAIESFLRFKPAVILLDVMLPDLDGFEVTKIIRNENKNVGIIALTALDQKRNKLEGFNSGVDDYVVKPFEIEELIARIDSLLRRLNNLSDNVIRYEELTVDKASKTAFYGDKQLILSKRELEILTLFIGSPGTVFSKDSILEAVWGEEYDGSQNIVEVYINYLRNKLGEAGKWLHTVRGWGYRLKKETDEARN